MIMGRWGVASVPPARRCAVGRTRWGGATAGATRAGHRAGPFALPTPDGRGAAPPLAGRPSWGGGVTVPRPPDPPSPRLWATASVGGGGRRDGRRDRVAAASSAADVAPTTVVVTATRWVEHTSAGQGGGAGVRRALLLV